MTKINTYGLFELEAYYAREELWMHSTNIEMRNNLSNVLKTKFEIKNFEETSNGIILCFKKHNTETKSGRVTDVLKIAFDAAVILLLENYWEPMQFDGGKLHFKKKY